MTGLVCILKTSPAALLEPGPGQRGQRCESTHEAVAVSWREDSSLGQGGGCGDVRHGKDQKFYFWRSKTGRIGEGVGYEEVEEKEAEKMPARCLAPISGPCAAPQDREAGGGPGPAEEHTVCFRLAWPTAPAGSLRHSLCRQILASPLENSSSSWVPLLNVRHLQPARLWAQRSGEDQGHGPGAQTRQESPSKETQTLSPTREEASSEQGGVEMSREAETDASELERSCLLCHSQGSREQLWAAPSAPRFHQGCSSPTQNVFLEVVGV